ncbi:MAG: hypothetical protein NW206_13970 [Hyphomonadaceae bacterium]|nr:hypothetical protein [Hyphomonadaceae bacterium]
MQDFILSGRAVDLVLLVIVAEFALLTWFGRGQPRRTAIDWFFALMPGALLLLALRAALTGSDWPWIAVLIAASFPFHLIDLLRRR